MPIVVNINKCTGCEECLTSCPFDAIEIREGRAFINEYCNFCKTCLSICPEGAIEEIEEAPVTLYSSPVTDFKGV